MVASARQRLILPIAPLGAGVAGVFVAVVFLAMPTAALETLVVESGVATLLNAAQPPLGLTARAVLALAGGGACALLVWIALFVAVGTRLLILNRAMPAGESVPMPRRGDAHPDAPPRQPVFATRDLGTPFLDVRAEPAAPAAMGTARARPLPANLDVPLSLFDPASFAAPSAPPPAPDPVEIVDPAPIVRDTPDATPIPIRGDTHETIEHIAASMRVIAPVSRSDAEPPMSIRALLDRLERALAQRNALPPPPLPAQSEAIRDALDALRGLTVRAR